jgi:hypothetical protein
MAEVANDSGESARLGLVEKASRESLSSFFVANGVVDESTTFFFGFLTVSSMTGRRN